MFPWPWQGEARLTSRGTFQTFKPALTDCKSADETPISVKDIQMQDLKKCLKPSQPHFLDQSPPWLREAFNKKTYIKSCESFHNWSDPPSPVGGEKNIFSTRDF